MSTPDTKQTTAEQPSLSPLEQFLDGHELGEFVPHASYHKHLDWLMWLDEDVGYVAKPVHPGLELLLHPQDQSRIVGFKVLGIVGLCKAVGLILPSSNHITKETTAKLDYRVLLAKYIFGD